MGGRVRSHATSILAVVLGFIPAASGFAEPGITGNEIVVGACTVLSGPNAGNGIATTQGAEAYFSLVNEKGGVFGRKIRFAKEDDHYSSIGASQCFRRELEMPVFVSGFPVSSAASVEYVQSAQTHKLPFVGFYSGADFITTPVKRYVFNTHATYGDQIRATVEALWNVLKVRRFAAIVQDDAYGNAVLKSLRLALKEHGAEPVSVGSFPTNAEDVRPAVDAARKGNPEAVLLGSSYNTAAKVIKEAADSGWKPMFLANSGIGTETFIHAAGKDAEGVVISQVVAPHDRSDFALVRQYEQALSRYSPQIQPSFPGLQGFVNAMVIVAGLEGAGKNPTREGFVRALERIHKRDVGMGKAFLLDYSPSDHRGFHEVYFTVVEHGTAQTLGDWRRFESKLE